MISFLLCPSVLALLARSTILRESTLIFFSWGGNCLATLLKLGSSFLKWQFLSPHRQCLTMKVYQSQLFCGTLYSRVPKGQKVQKGFFGLQVGGKISLLEKIASFKGFCKIREKSRNLMKSNLFDENAHKMYIYSKENCWYAG